MAAYDIRLIALDLDGTVFDDEKRISPRTLAALRAALDKGVTVIPATGRSVTGVPKEFLTMPGVRYALTSNGATVTELATRRPVVQQMFAPELAEQVYSLVEPYESLLSVFIDGEVYTTAENIAKAASMVPPNLRSYFQKNRDIVPDMVQAMREKPDKIEKFSIMYRDLATRDKAWHAVEAHCRVECTTSLDRNLEINAPGVTKGSGLLALARELGLRREQIMACGDSGNDLAMIEAAGLGVAMANGTEPIKAAAQYITLDNNHDGVAAAIEKFVL